MEKRKRKKEMKNLVGGLFTIMWILGVVIAKGFWSTLFAIIIPFWSWYLTVEFIFFKYL